VIPEKQIATVKAERESRSMHEATSLILPVIWKSTVRLTRMTHANS
jgi:hypothetical protein